VKKTSIRKDRPLIETGVAGSQKTAEHESTFLILCSKKGEKKLDGPPQMFDFAQDDKSVKLF